MNLFRRTGSNIAWILLSNLFSKGATIFVTVYLARVLGVSEFGVFSLGVAIANSIWPVVDLGTNGYGTREIARDRGSASTLLTSLNTMRLFASLFVIMIAVLVLGMFDVPDTKKWVIIAALAYLSTYAINPDWTVRGMEEMPLLFIINFVAAVAFIAGISLSVSGPEDVVQASFVRSISFGAGSVTGLALLYWKRQIIFRIKVELVEWSRLIRKTSFFLFNRMATNLGQYLPLFVVTFFLSDSSVGLYSAPHRLYIIAISGLGAITSAIYPILSSLYRKGSEQFSAYQKRLVHLLLMLFIPVAGIGLIGSKVIIDAVFGSEYSGASGILMILLITLPIVAIRTIYMFTLLCGGMEKITSSVMLIAVTVQAVAAIISVPNIGVVGAAVSMLVGETVAAGMLISHSTRRMGVDGPFNRQSATLLLIIAALMVLALVLNWGIVGIIMGGVPVYILLLVLFQQVPVEKIKKILISRGS